jgi:hypothetical protein
MLSRNPLILVLALCLVSGCVGQQIVPERRTASQLHRFYVVGIESPPLAIAGGAPSSTENSSSSVGSSVAYLPRYTIDLARGVGVLSTIAIFIALPGQSSARIEAPAFIKPIETWEPTLELAKIVAEQLSMSGKNADVSGKVEPLVTIQDRGRTFLMENWMAPIRSWYNDTEPKKQYRSLAQEGIDAVIEVGISNYEIAFSRKLLLQVHLKLIEPASGKILGRARAYSLTPVAPTEELFASNASTFKEVVTASGKQLIVSNLKELGLCFSAQLDSSQP